MSVNPRVPLRALYGRMSHQPCSTTRLNPYLASPAVDGSPVLDIKPYVPFCDAVANASAPDWVAPVADNEPLHVAAVVVTDAAEREIADAWQQVASSAKGSLFARATEFLSLVTEVLSRDIR